jgi:tetratricopeptide (TPR) repeat protein
MPTVGEAIAIALSHHRAGRLDLAEEIYRRVLDAEPQHADALHLTGLIALERGDDRRALEFLERAIHADAGQGVFHNSLGRVCASLGDFPQAERCYRRATELAPDLAEAHYNLGNVLRAIGKPADAVACYGRALQRKPDYVKAYVNLGIAQKDLGLLDEAIASYRAAIALDPRCAEAYLNQGNALHDQGKSAEGIACLRHALSLKPDYREARGNVLSAMQYVPGVGLGELAEAHAEFDRRHAAPLRADWRSHGSDPDPDRPLRLGFVSPDLAHHPVGRFLVGVLENLARQGSHVTCYSDRAVGDAISDRLRRAAAA